MKLRALAGLLNLQVVLALALFLPFGSLHYLRAWAFLAVFFSCTLAITLYLMRADPKLLERRTKAGPVAEARGVQKVIQAIAGLSFIGVFVLSAFDRRFGWSRVPAWGSVCGDVLVACGLVIVFFVFRENSFTSAVIEVGAGQKVVSTGPYAWVRHPMYLGASVMLLGVPVALGSWWGLLGLVPLLAAIVVRLFDEERFLTASLPGYAAYQRQVKRRLVPFVW